MMAARYARQGPIAAVVDLMKGENYRQETGALDRFRESVYNAPRGGRFGSAAGGGGPSDYNARRGGRLR